MVIAFLCGGLQLLFGLRNIFPRLQIRAKLLIAFAGLSVLPVLFVSLYGLYENIRTTERIALESLAHDVSTTRGRASNFLANIEGDLRVLLNSTDVEEYVHVLEGGNRREREIRLRQLGDELLAFARTKGIYYQFRVINENREEVLRIESSDILDSTPHFSKVPPAALWHDGLSYYFLLTENLHRGEITFSPVELVYRATQRLPVLSFATPLFDSGKPVGLLIANVFAGNLFNELEAQRNLGMNEKIVLVSSDGHYLYNSDERGDWNRLIASRQEDNLQKDYPSPVARAILSGSEGMTSGNNNEIIAYAPLLPLVRLAPRVEFNQALATSLFIFETVPRESITHDARASATTFVGFLVLFLGGALGLGLLATRQFTHPISELQRGAEIISRGNYHYRLNVESGDEIETLARRFNVMAHSLEEHEREILEHRTHLEEMVDHRTRELVEKKGKLQAILDNVPSAFVMLDGSGCIQTASAAFTSITGLSLEDVIGKEGSAVFRNAGLCQGANAPDIRRWEKIEVHTDRTVNGSGVEKFLEHMTIPIVENGHVTAILQIMTDITKRKRLEEHLIRSEKLMATGEMAAIIAHGFRNSLTSIKMILQLQQESRLLGTSGKRSLGVALDSIGRMETVVQELLNFARPSPMVLAMAELNALVEQALALLQTRIREYGIAVTQSLDPRIPPMLLDGAQVREATVNLLLNAIQSLDSASEKGEKRKITVATKRLALRKTLRDYPAPAMTDVEGDQTNGQEIVLRKGRECVAITITDNGPGMDRTTMRRIFDPFFTTKTNGTGLGLPMVKRSVNAHGGVLSAKSTKGKGATFEIVLPLRLDLPDEPKASPAPGGKA